MLEKTTINYPKKNSTFKILIVGIGNIGLRYTQGFFNSKHNISLSLYDISSKQIDKTQLFLKKSIPKQYKNIYFYKTFSEIKGSFDLAVIATNAKNRYEIVEKINSKMKIKHWVLEKILEQSPERCTQIIDTIRNNDLAWVNLPRRQMKFYRKLKKQFSNKNIKKIKIIGGNWGLACNSIHFMDLIEFLSDDIIENLKFFTNDKFWFPSKREGFYEINGYFRGSTKNQKLKFEINSLNYNSDIKVIIVLDDQTLVINETQNILIVNDIEKCKSIGTTKSCCN